MFSYSQAGVDLYEAFLGVAVLGRVQINISENLADLQIKPENFGGFSGLYGKCWQISRAGYRCLTLSLVYLYIICLSSRKARGAVSERASSARWVPIHTIHVL